MKKNWWHRCPQLVLRVLVVVWSLSVTLDGVFAMDAVGKPNDFKDTGPFAVYLRTKAGDESSSLIVRYNNFGILVNLFARVLSVGAGVFFFFLILSAGYKLIFSTSKSDALNQVRKQLTIGIIGLLITMSAYWLTQLLLQITNISATMYATTETPQ